MVKNNPPIDGPRPGARHAALDYRPPRYVALIRRGLFTIAVIAAVSVVYTAGWFFAASKLRNGIVELVAEKRQQGYSAAYDKIEIAGFPGAIQVIVGQPRYGNGAGKSSGPGTGGLAPWAWQGSRLVAEIKPWAIGRMKVDLAGQQKVSFSIEGRSVAYAGQADILNASFVLHEDGLPRILEINIGGVNLVPQGSVGASPGDASVKTLAASIRAERLFPDKPSYRTPTLSAAISARGVRLPRFLRLPLGHEVTDLEIVGAIMGEVPNAPPAQGLVDWRDKGGTLELSRFEARYGPLYIRANGTLALDEALQPVGAMTAKLEGFFLALEALKNARLIRSRDAAMAKVVLGALAKRPPGGGPPTISLPLTVQDGRVYAGPVTLIELPRIVWPGPIDDGELKILK